MIIRLPEGGEPVVWRVEIGVKPITAHEEPEMTSLMQSAAFAVPADIAYYAVARIL